MENMNERDTADWIRKLRDEICGLDFFDAELWIGRSQAFPLMNKGTVDLLESRCRKEGITGGLVSHWLHKRYSPAASNRHLLDSIAGKSGFYAVLTGLPSFPRDNWYFDSPLVKGVRLHPATFFFPLVDWCVGELCGMLTEKRMPLMVFHTETEFRDIYMLAREHPELKIIVESQVKKIIYHGRQVLALMRECPNVYLEISNWYGPGLLEYTSAHIGSHRMVFGSFMPANDPLVSMGLVISSSLPKSDKKRIAGGNIREIIAEVKT